jgi:hypothetical protein
LPLPRSKGGAFPFLLTSMGTPLLPADFRSETMGFPQNSGNSGIQGKGIKSLTIGTASSYFCIRD